MSTREMFTQEFWDERYAGREHVWSGRPNPQLVAEVSALAPGTALDVGSGEGADAVWLAGRGWRVTGIDISAVGLSRAAEHAAQAGAEIAGRIEWRRVDLFAEPFEPLGTYDLVSSQYLHLPPEVRAPAFGRLAESVAPGGRLLVVSHHPLDLEIPGLRPNVPELFYPAGELAGLLDPARWDIVAEAARERTVDRPTGERVTVRDAVLHARRRD
jgi:SAM-dependent methyltransferase